MRIETILMLLLCVNLQLKAQEEANSNDTGNMPLKLIKGKIIIPVQIQTKTYKFLVDTGGIFEISEKLQNEFNFSQTATTKITGINRKEIDIKTVTVPEIKLGNWIFKNRKAIVSDLHSKYPYSCFELDGMIGRDFFDNVILQFDYASNTFRLSKNIDNIKIDKKNRTKLKLSKRGLPDIQLRINGKKEYIEFDSGSGDFFSPKTGDVEKKLNKVNTDDILSYQGKFSFGITMENIRITNRYIEKVEHFQIANTNFNNFYSQFSKVSAPRIGAGILKYGKVTLDYKKGWFYYQPYSKSQQRDPFKTFGFDIAIENGHYKVKWTLEKSDAHKLGLRSGHIILSIDDIIIQHIQEDCYGYLNGYTFKNKQKIRLRYLDHEHNEKLIELSKKTYE